SARTIPATCSPRSCSSRSNTPARSISWNSSARAWLYAASRLSVPGILPPPLALPNRPEGPRKHTPRHRGPARTRWRHAPRPAGPRLALPDAAAAVGEKSGTGARRAGKPGGSDRAESGETWIRFDEADTGGARRTTGSAGAPPSGVVSSPVARSGVGGAGGLHPLRRHAGAHHPVLAHQRVHRHRPPHGHPAPAGEPAVRRAGPGLGAAARAHGSLRRGPDQPL